MPYYYSFNASTPCVSLNQTFCIYKVNIKVRQIIDACTECPLECDSIDYSLTTSFAEFPSALYGDLFLKKSGLKQNLSELRKGVLSINVYYSSLRYTEITQLEKSTVVDLVCSIGGTMGLFLGASLLSLIELLEALISVFLVKLKILDKEFEFLTKKSRKKSSTS